MNNKLLLPYLNNKLLLNLNSIPKVNLIVVNNLGIKSTKDFKLIKNIITLELFLNKRPKIFASFYNKQLIIRLVSSVKISDLQFLQKSPVPWSRYIDGFSLFDKKFINPSMVNQISLTCTAKNNSYISLWIKSAYLD